MIGWSTKHRNLTALVGLVLIAFVASVMFGLRPKQRDVRALEENVQRLESDLRRTGWPLDPDRLDRLKDVKAKERDKLRLQSDELLEQATSVFVEKIRRQYGSTEEFRTNVSRLDFTEELNQLQLYCRSRGRIVLAEEVLNLSEKTDSVNTYQMVLQVWTLRAVLDLALASKLFPRESGIWVETDVERAGRREKEAVACLSVLPVRGYSLRPEDKEPYLLEIPVRLGFRGKLEDLCTFLARLQNAEILDWDTARGDKSDQTHQLRCFFPVSHVEVRKTMPGEEQRVTDEIDVDVECSAFFRFKDVTPAVIRDKKTQGPPPGA